MALPADVQTVTITGTYLDTQGAPCSGTISFSPPCRITSTFGGVILAGSITVELDDTGSFSVDLPCTDQDGINPQCFTYEVTENLSCTNCPRHYNIGVPCDQDGWDISELAPVDSAPGVLIVQGPPGPPGPAGAYVEGEQPITVTGTGAETDPYMVGLQLSPQAGNSLTVTEDGGLYATGGGQTFLEAGDQVEITGTGTAADPYVINSVDTVTAVTGGNGILVGTTTADPTVYVVAADISTDPGNSLILGSDTGLYAPFASLSAGANVTVTGTGSPDDPYVISSTGTGTATSLTAGANVTITGTGTSTDPYVIAATDTNTVTTLTAGDGIDVTGTPTAGYTVAADLSTDTGNSLQLGTDGGLYAPAGAVTAVTSGANVTVTGTGTAADPYVIAATDTNTVTTVTGDNGVTATGSPTAGYLVEADLSTDADNLLQLGSDGALYVPHPFVYGYGQTNTVTLGTSNTTLTPTLTAATDGDFTISGTGVVVTRSGVYSAEAQFRFNATIPDATTPPTSLVFADLNIGGAARSAAHAVVRGSTLHAITVTRMEDCAAGQVFSFAARLNFLAAFSATPTCGPVWWSLHRIGPSLQYE